LSNIEVAFTIQLMESTSNSSIYPFQRRLTVRPETGNSAEEGHDTL
jgi:hypothetical protein